MIVFIIVLLVGMIVIYFVCEIVCMGGEIFYLEIRKGFVMFVGEEYEY